MELGDDTNNCDIFVDEKKKNLSKNDPFYAISIIYPSNYDTYGLGYDLYPINM